MKKSVFILLFAFLWMGSEAREVRRVNDGWRFALADDPAFREPGFDDSSWRVLDLPHDWAFEGGYAPDGAQGERGGYACGGIGWYRKALQLDPRDLAGKVFLDFEAVYMNSDVWVNGHHLGKRPYGYISFGYDITDFVHKGRNTIVVRVDNSLEPSARWYHGCGIYGSVHVRLVPEMHFRPWGTFVTTPQIDERVAVIEVCAEIENPEPGTIVRFEVRDGRGKIAAKGVADVMDGRASAAMRVSDPSLWSPENPDLYVLYAKILHNKKIVDEVSERFGIRSIAWEPETGFWLNGCNVKLNGVCEHLEGGPLGAAWNAKMMRWKLQILKDMGCNAIRTAHNPQLPVFYDLCDEMGILVMDEAFDGWRKKADFDYGMQAFERWWERDLRDMVRRDRNHPCVVIYSVGNETRGPVAADLVRVCHEEDPTRLVTSGHSGSESMDVLGINGHSEKRSFLTEYIPGKQAFVGTETPHTWQVRGFYRTRTWYRDGYPNRSQDPFETPDLTDREVFAYDWTSPANRKNSKQVFNSSYDNAFVRINARQNLEFLRDKAWYSGHFRWTGFDYLGEAGYVHGGWPFRAFMGGVVDMAGFAKDHYYLYQSQWRPQINMIHILPHWTHPYTDPGTEIPVWVYTTGDEAELLLNGKSLGRRQRGREWNRMQCEWLVGWQPGMLEAVAYRGGREIARSVVKTSSEPARLHVGSDTRSLANGPDDMAIITISQTDRHGTSYPYGENRVWFHTPPGVVVRSAENGNPVDVETNFLASSKRLFFGMLRVFVQADTPQNDLSFVAGSICGDKALKISPFVSIDVREVPLRGNPPPRDLEIRYTTDGTDPGTGSKRYEGAFAAAPGTTVRAAVFDGGVRLLTMEESFATGEGLYWGTPGEEPATDRGLQAEDAVLQRAQTRKDETAVFVTLAPGGSAAWYQENDGGEHTATFVVRYRMRKTDRSARLELYNNDSKTGEIGFPDTGDTQWREQRIEMTLHKGANHIRLENTMNTDSPDLDFVYLAY